MPGVSVHQRTERLGFGDHGAACRPPSRARTLGRRRVCLRRFRRASL